MRYKTVVILFGAGVLVAAGCWVAAVAHQTQGQPALTALAAEVTASPSSPANVQERSKRFERVLSWAREEFPETTKVEDTLLFSAEIHAERNEMQAACADFDAGILALRDLAQGKLRLATPTGQEGVHPHLFVRPEGLSALREKARGTHREIWEVMERLLSTDLAQYPPPAPDAALRDKGIDPLRGHGELPSLGAFAAMISEKPAHIRDAKRRLLAACAVQRWGTAAGGEDNGHEHDLVAGHFLTGVACAYDWLYPYLTPDERMQVRNKLANQAAVMYAAATLKGRKRKTGWQRTYFQNHNWICNTGLGLAGWALQGEFQEADAWMAQCESNALAVLKAWEGVTDGSNHEGYSYWSYGTKFLFIALDQIGCVRGKNLFQINAWLRAQANWRLHGTLPNRADVLAIADGNRREPHGTVALLRKLAREYRDGAAEQLARDVTQRRKYVTRASEAVWEFLWYDPSVVPQALEALPCSAHFPDHGLVTARSGWDPDATFVSFKCGAPGGRAQFDHARGEYPNVTYLDVGHDHPDQNSFTLFSHGVYLLDDGGYEKPKQTSNHNTLLIDGQGQIGEGRTWFGPRDFKILTEDRTARILLYRDAGTHVEVVGEAAKCYPEELGLKNFTRRLIFLRPNMVLIKNDLEARQPRRFDFVLRRYDGDFSATNDAILSPAAHGPAELVIEVLAPRPGQWTAETFSSRVQPSSPRLHGIKLRPKEATNTVQFVMLACPLIAGQSRPRATLSTDASATKITVHSGETKTWTIMIPCDPAASSDVTVK